MIKKEAVEGLEPIEEVERAGLISAPKSLPAGMRINIRGRSIYLRGIRLPQKALGNIF